MENGKKDKRGRNKGERGKGVIFFFPLFTFPPSPKLLSPPLSGPESCVAKAHASEPFNQFNNPLVLKKNRARYGVMKKAKIHHSFAWSDFNFKQRVVAIISLLAGNRDTGGTFANLGTNANFWSSSQSGTSAWNRNLNSGNPTVNRNLNSKANGFSVRCLSIGLNASSSLARGRAWNVSGK